MSPEQFISSLKNEVLTENLKLEIGQLSGLSRSPSTQLYAQLSAEQKATLIELIRTTIINTTSNILGILDSSSYLDSSREKFTLIAKSDQTILTGTLQDTFIEMVEIEENTIGRKTNARNNYKA